MVWNCPDVVLIWVIGLVVSWHCLPLIILPSLVCLSPSFLLSLGLFCSQRPSVLLMFSVPVFLDYCHCWYIIFVFVFLLCFLPWTLHCLPFLLLGLSYFGVFDLLDHLSFFVYTCLQLLVLCLGRPTGKTVTDFSWKNCLHAYKSRNSVSNSGHWLSAKTKGGTNTKHLR